jgi:hypothetical protein
MLQRGKNVLSQTCTWVSPEFKVSHRQAKRTVERTFLQESQVQYFPLELSSTGFIAGVFIVEPV